ncbi:MAG TPA: nucleoside-diphosphate sugar epimerase/dehydratase [Acidobacteriota bacterium]|nr:nucleoside-diphosphate sugar epimerase/dehydratase [Acidobacteriota bacterium]
MGRMVRTVMKNRSLYKNFLIVLVVDALLLSAAWYSAYLLRFNFQVPPEHWGVITLTLPFIITTKIVIFYLFNLYQGMWRYTSIGDLLNIIKAAIVSSLLIVSLIFFTRTLDTFSRSAFLIDWVLTIVFISGYRVGIRLYFWVGSRGNTSLIDALSLLTTRQEIRTDAKNLLIIGAGDCGEKMYREIRDNARLRYNIIGFIDDNPAKVGMKVHGIEVLGTTRELKTIYAKVRADEALIAIPSATSEQMRSIVSCCDQTNIPFKTVPSLGELIDGKVTVNGIRDVDYCDLLGREVIHLDEERIGRYLENARVLVTGAGGSIGSELCRQICRYGPSRLILYERAESPLYEMELELKRDFSNIEIIPLLADVRDRHELSRAFAAHGPQVVFHAAAYKHVPMLELQPWKAIENNIVGTNNVVEVSKEYSVDRFVFVSTDKAVRPANIMGASKRVAELIVQGQNGHGLSQNRFMTVRFGNVVGSIGSVVPLFKSQIAKGGPVTVTHPDVIRYFMTIPEACQLILQAGGMGEGGEIFILDMGTPIKIADMARDLIRLSGFEPDVGIKIEYIGLRPGEKLYEELITEDEGLVPTSHEKILVLRGLARDQLTLNGKIDELAQLAQDHKWKEIKLKLLEIVPEYIPREIEL